MRILGIVLAAVGASLLSGCAVGLPEAATNISATAATLNGRVAGTSDGTLTYWFRYGKTVGYGMETPHRSLTVSDRDFHSVSEGLTGLSPDTTYHSQLCVRDQEGDQPRVVCSKDHTFGTIGDTLRGSVFEHANFGGSGVTNEIITFDAYSGPHSENGGGRIHIRNRYGGETDHDVTCLRLQGQQVTVGVRSLDGSQRTFWFFAVPQTGGESGYQIESVGNRPDTDCSVQYSGPPPDPEAYDSLTQVYEDPLVAHDVP